MKQYQYIKDFLDETCQTWDKDEPHNRYAMLYKKVACFGWYDELNYEFIMIPMSVTDDIGNGCGQRIKFEFELKNKIMESQQAINDIKSIRVNIDILINTIKFLNPSREISLAHTNLQRAKMWLGKCLAELGNKTPYPQSENPDNRTIEPQADHTNDSLLEDNMDQVTNVKMLRSHIQVGLNLMRTFTSESVPTEIRVSDAKDYYSHYFMTSIFALEEAKMWLGWELDRIRKDSENIPNEKK